MGAIRAQLWFTRLLWQAGAVVSLAKDGRAWLSVHPALKNGDLYVSASRRAFLTVSRCALTLAVFFAGGVSRINLLEKA
jgi:hypothetical protein